MGNRLKGGFMKKVLILMLMIFLMPSFLLYAEKEYKPDCGVYSMGVITNIPLSELIEAFKDIPTFKMGRGTNRTDLVIIAKKFNLVLLYRKIEYLELMSLGKPVIVSLMTRSPKIANDGQIYITGHWVVVTKATLDKVYLISNGKEETMDACKFQSIWEKFILEKIN
jgi:glycosyltransferase involved in cell wall biosynthesis